MTRTTDHPVARLTPAELREKLLETGDRLRELREKPADDRSANWTADLRRTTDEIRALDAELSVAERTAEQRATGTGPQAALATPTEHRTAGDLVIASEQYAGRGARQFAGVEVRTLLSSETSDPAAGALLPKGQPIPPIPRQLELRIRDLLSVQQTGLSSVTYVRELNPAATELGATAVAESGLKPEATMQFEAADAPTRKIAAWVPVTTEIVDDAPTLRGYIDERLAYMVGRAEDDQLLNGVGTAPYVRGIRQTSGVQAQTLVSTGGSGSAADPVTTIGRAMGKVENVDLTADGVVLHPTDYWALVTTRHANQFDAGYTGGSPFGAPTQTIFGVPAVRTRAMTAGKALVGAWRMGATLFDRQSITVSMTDSHSDYFIYNRLVILAEERVALAVMRPDAFVEATIA